MTTPRTARSYRSLVGEQAWLLEGGGLPARQVAAQSEAAARMIDAIRSRLAADAREAEAWIERIRGEESDHADMR